MTTHSTAIWKLAQDRELKLDRPRILAIVNVTPDSFSDGGRYDTLDRAVEFSLRCLDAGADMLDIGGESTRPGATSVPPDVQMHRVLPVIKQVLRIRPDTLISVDTTSSRVARSALDAGAHVINDVSAGTDDPTVFEVVSQARAGVILMHRLRPPAQDVFSHEYSNVDRPTYVGDVVQAVMNWLRARAESATDASVARESIVLDPGLGFGKTVEQNFDLVRSFDRLAEPGFPLLSAASRKSFIGKVTGVKNASERVIGTLTVSLIHLMMNVRIFRVHDVSEHRQAFDCAQACLGFDPRS